MYSALQRLNVLSTFYSTCLITTLVIIGLGNFLLPVREPNVHLALSRVALRRGVEDYYMNKSTWLADIKFDLEAGTGSPRVRTHPPDAGLGRL